MTEVDRAPLGPGALVVFEATFDDDEGSERYLVPLVDGHDPADGEGLWMALADAIGREERIGHFVTRREAGFAPVPEGERRLTVEQSNTSVVLGETADPEAVPPPRVGGEPGRRGQRIPRGCRVRRHARPRRIRHL